MKPPGMMDGSQRAMIAPTALVVDDEPEVRKVVRSILLRQGYEVLEAEDGAAAFELLRRLSGGVQLLVCGRAYQGDSQPPLPSKTLPV